MSDENNIKRSSTADLKHDHFTLKRVGEIAQRCSDKLYAGDEDIPIEDIEILSVVIEEFIDAFHHGKEEKAYFPVTKSKDRYSEDIRKFLIEHELGSRAFLMQLEGSILYRKHAYYGSCIIIIIASGGSSSTTLDHTVCDGIFPSNRLNNSSSYRLTVIPNRRTEHDK